MAENCARGRAGHCGGGVVVADAAPSGQARIARVGHPAAACFPALVIIHTGASSNGLWFADAGRIYIHYMDTCICQHQHLHCAQALPEGTRHHWGTK